MATLTFAVGPTLGMSQFQKVALLDGDDIKHLGRWATSRADEAVHEAFLEVTGEEAGWVGVNEYEDAPKGYKWAVSASSK